VIITSHLIFGKGYSMKRIIIVAVFLGGISCAIPITAQDLNAFFTQEEAIGRFDQIREALNQFRDFTQTIFERSDLGSKHDVYVLYENSIPESALIVVGMTGKDFQRSGYLNWDMQHIGFPNWMKYLQGYIEYLELKNKKLTLELSILEDQPADIIDSLRAVIDDEEGRLQSSFLHEDEWVD